MSLPDAHPARHWRLPRLKTTLDQFTAADGTLYVLRPGTAEDIAFESPSAAERRLLDRLRVARPLEHLWEEFAHELPVDEVLQQLDDLGLLEDAGNDERLPELDRERYDRQLAYFSEVGSPGTDRVGCQLELARSRVTVIGVGGLGSWTALALACAGVGRIDAVDGDTVELSNLNRQVLYGPDDLGREKASAAADALRGFNPGLDCRAIPRRLTAHMEVAEVIAGSDVVVATADWPPFRIGQWINAACFAAGIPWIAASQFPPQVRIGPTYLPGETGCLTCQETEWRGTYPLLDEVAEAGRLSGEVAASFGPACALIGAMLASDVVHLLTGVVRPSTAGVALLMDIRTGNIDREKVPWLRGCESCGGPGGRRWDEGSTVERHRGRAGP
jgi:molybdopterin-synthase adenylyltransferase